MENRRYFELTIGNTFERRFQLNGTEYLLKQTANGNISQDYYDRRTNLLTIENKSDISLFVKIKLYRKNDQHRVLKKSSVLQTGRETEINLSNLRSNYGSGPFICSVKVARYENWQNIVDSQKKTNPTKNVTSSKDPITESRLNDLSSDMKRLLEHGEHSDVILCDGSNEFRAHKSILSARSKVFCKMFQHPMKENRENRVTITDVPSDVVKEMLTFMYTGVINMKDMKITRDLYMAADKYDVKELRAVCSKHLKDVDLDSVLDTLVLADMYEDQSLKQSCLDFISANYSRVKAHKKWGGFMKANQILALEVLSFVLDNKT